MKKTIVIASFLVSLNCCSQNPINLDLKKQLDSILFTDQIFREYLDVNTSQERKESIAKITNYTITDLDNNIWKFINEADSLNLIKVENIISKYGYPGKTLVGEPTNTAVFFVIQHSSKISKYYPVIEKAAKTGELPFKYAAMMLDRMLIEKDEEQVYGTQVWMNMIINPKTNKKERFEYVFPIKDAKNVNKRRKKAGFDLTVEENALRLGVVYKKYTLKELNMILKNKL